MSTQHTPEPWQILPVYQDDNGQWKILLRRTGGGAPAIAQITGNTQEQAEANAHLIWAAPDMLTELIEDLDVLIVLKPIASNNGYPSLAGEINDRITRLKSAIAKATNSTAHP